MSILGPALRLRGAHTVSGATALQAGPWRRGAIGVREGEVMSLHGRVQARLSREAFAVDGEVSACKNQFFF